MGHPLITGKDITWADNKLIVSKTDLSGRITYANRQFMQIAGYHEEELLGVCIILSGTPLCLAVLLN
ncbi:PAS domain S-box protein [Psychromonas sp. KJ10-10]|uniref:PAS domain S-box protein n=1 Tax=Psychromonas sp. KJ10-10 TaxID=3391823 RepID=UPI0039B4B37B